MLRIVAALLVILDHAYDLCGTTAPGDGLLGRAGLNWGEVGVVIFFATSGFLVTRSWTLDPVARDFVTKRVLRIWPGFVVMLVLLAFALGPAVTTESVGSYLHSHTPVTFVAHNVVMSPIAFSLPHVFAGNPDSAVNGSLWTLPYEVLAYCGVLALGVLGVLRRRYVVVGILVLLAVLFPLHHLRVAGHDVLWGWRPDGIYLGQLVRLLVPFVVGASLWLFRDRVPLRPLGAGLCVAGTVVAIGLDWNALVPSLFLPYLVVWGGTRASTLGRTLHGFGDPSYGAYIYAFPIQQVLVQVVGRHGLLVLLASAPLSLAAGYASWHLIERRALRLRWRRTSTQLA